MAFFIVQEEGKMKRMLKWLVIMTVVAGVALPGQATRADAATIKVGAAINLTGPASTWGQYHAKGQQDYFRYVNDVKGGVAGRPIEMILVDTGYKVTDAVAAVRKFAVSDNVDMIATWSAGEPCGETHHSAVQDSDHQFFDELGDPRGAH
jgi:hypothetical protein